jgi:glycosyltransferase involved in cell wall biosynthesis
MALAAELGVASDVALTGFIANPYPYMKRAGVFVLSSRYEGLSNVLIQALACGCPVVSTDCPHGPAEIVEGRAYGRLVPVGDAQAMAAAIQATLDEPPDRNRLRQRGAYFTVERAVDAYLALLLPGGPKR